MPSASAEGMKTTMIMETGCFTLGRVDATARASRCAPSAYWKGGGVDVVAGVVGPPTLPQLPALTNNHPPADLATCPYLPSNLYHPHIVLHHRRSRTSSG